MMTFDEQRRLEDLPPIPANPPPPPDMRSDGSFETGAVRVRSGLFGFAIIEEQIQDVFGSRFWQRIRFPMLLNKGELR